MPHVHTQREKKQEKWNERNVQTVTKRGMKEMQLSRRRTTAERRASRSPTPTEHDERYATRSCFVRGCTWTALRSLPRTWKTARTRVAKKQDRWRGG